MTYELEGNFTTDRLFRNVPELKYLPTAACERGMYGTFVQGTTQLFFVFGYDQKTVMEGDFIEIDTSLYLEKEYLEERRVHIHSQYVLRRSYNAYPICQPDYSASEIQCILGFMDNLERITAFSKEFDIPLTEYFNYSTEFDILAKQYLNDLSTTFSQLERNKLKKELIYHFKSHMMTSENPRPEDEGLTIEDYRTSAYCVDTNPWAIEKAYRHPQKWESHLFGYTKDYADNPALSAVFIRRFIVKDLEKLLNLHRIPYRFARPEEASPKLMRHLSVTDLNGNWEDPGARVILVYPAMYSVFMHTLMRWANINFYFTSEEKAEGYRLYKTGQFYGFSIPLIYPVIRFLRSMGIKLYSNEFFQCRVLSGGGDVYCFAPLRQKPLVDAALLAYNAQLAYTHDQGSVEFCAASELRIPKWEGGHQISICEYGYEQGRHKDGSIAEMDYYNLHVDHVPDETLAEHGLLTELEYTHDYIDNRPLNDDERLEKPVGESLYCWREV